MFDNSNNICEKNANLKIAIFCFLTIKEKLNLIEVNPLFYHKSYFEKGITVKI